MSQTQSRVNGLEGLATLKDQIATVDTTQGQAPVTDKEAKAIPDPTRASGYVKQAHAHQHSQKQHHNSNTPAQRKPRTHGNVNPEAEATMIRSRIAHELPSLEDFIMLLQNHKFSFTIVNPENLGMFVASNRNEMRLHHMAWAGGDMYMIALQRAMTKALENSLAIRAATLTEGMVMSEEVCNALGLETVKPKKPKHNHPPKQHKPQNVKPAVDEEQQVQQ